MLISISLISDQDRERTNHPFAIHDTILPFPDEPRRPSPADCIYLLHVLNAMMQFFTAVLRDAHRGRFRSVSPRDFRAQLSHARNVLDILSELADYLEYHRWDRYLESLGLTDAQRLFALHAFRAHNG